MTKPILLAVLGIAGGALAALPGLAQNPDRPRPEGPRPDRASFEREIGLTEAQASQLRQLQQADRKLAIRRQADLTIARMDLEELFEATAVDEKAVAAKAKALADLEAAALKARVDHQLAVRRIVSAEQFQKMRMAQPRGAGHGPDGRRGPGPHGPRFGPPPGPDGRPGAPPQGDDGLDDLLGDEIR